MAYWDDAQPASTTVTTSSEGADWLEDAYDGNPNSTGSDPVEDLRRRMETLGQNEGLERGMKLGEEKGFIIGFKSEAPRAVMLGRCLGAAKAVNKIKPNTVALAKAISELEGAAKEFWVSQPRLVDEKTLAVYKELARLGVAIPEWPSSLS